MYTVPVKVYSAPREIKDPANSISGLTTLKTYEVIINVNDMPAGLPTDPNPRDAKPKGKTYVEIINSLNSDDGLFHKKNKGMTLVAGKTDYDARNQIFKLSFRKGKDPKSSDGILDGGHTYNIITNHREDGLSNQYVKATIMVGVPSDLIPELSAGLNNSTALNDSSKLNHKNKFDWIKESLKDQDYAEDVVYFQNDEGSILVDDIIAYMTALNIDLYPVSGGTQPIIAYNSKGGCLAKFRENEDSYKKFEKILPDILALFDHISIELREAYNANGGNAGSLSVYNSTKIPTRGKRRSHKLAFIADETYHRLEKGVNLAVLSSFRTQIRTKKVKGVDYFVWKDGIENVYKILEDNALDIMEDIINTYNDVRNITQLSKSQTLWRSLLKTLRLG